MESHGFTLVWERSLKELSSLARLWRHNKTGAEVFSCINKDENKVFGVSFRTPPADSTGVAHILEHSVLCGSKKYPLKEPFVELLKGSLQTFLNAFTYPDKTCYPVASANLQDFYNLMDVYLDAVFFPVISQDIFSQEGWHLEPDDFAGEDEVPAESQAPTFIYKGVVYNEMKGAFSAPESVAARYSLHALFPDTVYGLESGGDPEHIPDLTYADFCEFHRTYYHPSNARFFFWGDDPEDERLCRLGEVLQSFSALKVDSQIGVQSFMPTPRSISVPFAASEAAEGELEKGMVTVNWLGPDVMEIELVLAFRMLEYMLLGMPASPLRRRLIESGLGEDIAGQGLEAELRQLIFDVGLKGIAIENAPKIEALILETLRDLASEGLPEDLIDAAVNSVEFTLRENNSGRFPVGLSVMLRALTTWLHDGDPTLPLTFEEPLGFIKKRIADGEGYFEGLITRWFLENTHRVTVLLTPDTDLEAQKQQEETQRLARLTAAMDEDEKLRTVSAAESLIAWQSIPDSPAALATIPRLKVADLPDKNASIPTNKDPIVPIYFHGLPTGGIVYAEIYFDLGGISNRQLALLPLFGRALVEMGTKKHGFVELNMAISRSTGGIDTDVLLSSQHMGRVPVARLVLGGKATPDKTQAMFDLMREILLESVFADKSRFRNMILEEKARLEHSLVPAGHMIAATRLGASLSLGGSLTETVDGLSQLFFLRTLAEQAEADWPSLLAELEDLRRILLVQGRIECNVTANYEQQDTLVTMLKDVIKALPEGTATLPLWQELELPAAEAILLPAQVNYVAKGINLFDAGYSWHGSAMVILKYLRTGYLWERVRVQGGAYGCMCSLNRMNGAFYMVSYRDPNIQATLDVYDKTANYLQGMNIAKSEIDAAIVGAIGELDTYLLPDAKGSAAYIRMLVGDTEERRQQLREEILSTNFMHFNDFGKMLEVFSEKGRICALGGNALETAARTAGWHTFKAL